MTVALIVLASALAASVISNALSLRWGMKAKDAEVAAVKREVDEKTAHAVTRSERDGLSAQLATKTEQLAREQTLRAVAEAQRNEAQRKDREHVGAEILASNMDDAVRIAADRVSAAVSSVPDSSAGDNDRGAGGVQPAGPAKVDPILTLK